ECARLVEEAGAFLGAEAIDPMASRIIRSLEDEFAATPFGWGTDNLQLRLESVYGRVLYLGGEPLTDGYHFAQTIVNDYGRPYFSGANFISGVSGYAVAGPLAFYVRGEYDRAPANLQPLERPGALTPADEFGLSFLAPAAPLPAVSTLHLLDAYVAFKLGAWQVSAGRQSLWWGPGSSGALMWSNNAQPVTMVRITRPNPALLPGILKHLGPMRTELLFGRLAGHHFVHTQSGTQGTFDLPLANAPWIHGQKISFRPTPNLEFGVSRTGIFGGPDFPVTARSAFHSLFSGGNEFGTNDPGDRRSGFDFSYRIPKLRNWLVLYNDSLVEDEISP